MWPQGVVFFFLKKVSSETIVPFAFLIWMNVSNVTRKARAQESLAEHYDIQRVQ